jgi:predicted DNA-binding protein YlxM (UPF0122 family)
MAKDIKISLLLDFYGDMLTPKQREVAELYYNEDLSLAEIAQHSGITRQGVRDSIKRAEFQLLEYENVLGLHGRFLQMQEALAEIAGCAADLMEIHNKLKLSGEAVAKTRRIIELANDLNN